MAGTARQIRTLISVITMKFLTSILVFGLIITTTTSAQQPPNRLNDNKLAVSAEKSGLVVTVSLTKKLVAGAPVDLECVIENKTKSPIYYYRSGYGRIFHTKLVVDDGKAVSATKFGKRYILGPAGILSQISQIELLPGEKHKTIVPLARLYDLTLAGKYVLEELSLSAEFDSCSGIYVNLGKIELKLEEPKD